MPTTGRSGATIYFETHGDPDGVPLQMINGLGSQVIRWDPELVDAFVNRGFFVITQDNRDLGQSQWFDDATDTPAYRLSDMAADAVAVLDELGVARAHVLGTSMGGMIAQTMVLEHPDRVASLTSIMSTTSDPDLPGPTPEAQAALLQQPPPDREGAIENSVASWRVICSPDQFEEDLVRARAAAAYDRAFHPEGVARQVMAVMGSPPRGDALRAVEVPALVIHGDADPLIPVEAGRRTAEVIPGAELLVVEGMGHDVERVFQPQIIEAVTRLAATVEVQA